MSPLLRAPIWGNVYRDEKIVISTMHQKDRVIGESLKRTLNARPVVPVGIDTDALGTFTGEVERKDTVLATAIAKARLGMAKTGIRFGLANEGSFGPHPSIPLLAAGIEVMVLVDDLREIVVSESLIDDVPRFHNTAVTPKDDLADFLKQAGFPNHGLVVCPDVQQKPSDEGWTKGITDATALRLAIQKAAGLSENGRALIQNDMRAHMNPTRMQSIKRLADTLCQRIKTACPKCTMPGFGKQGMQKGLPCHECGTPTDLARGFIYGCVSCDHTCFKPRDDKLASASPQFCLCCNP